MTNKEIAEILANRCVGTNTDKLHFAIQLFVEEVVLDDSIEAYDEKDMEQYILEYLNMKERKYEENIRTMGCTKRNRNIRS